MEKIKAKVKLGIQLTQKEEAQYLLFIASDKEVNEYLKIKRRNKK